MKLKTALVVEQCEAFGLGEVVGRIRIEEGVDGGGRPVHRREAIACHEPADLTQLLIHQRMSQIVSQCDVPQSDNGMGLPGG